MNPDELSKKPLSLEREEEPEQDAIFEMANLDQRRTGINGRIYASSKQGSHGPSIKFYPNPRDQGQSVSISIEDHPRVLASTPGLALPQKTLEQLFEFVQKNKTVLLRY